MKMRSKTRSMLNKRKKNLRTAVSTVSRKTAKPRSKSSSETTTETLSLVETTNLQLTANLKLEESLRQAIDKWMRMKLEVTNDQTQDPKLQRIANSLQRFLDARLSSRALIALELQERRLRSRSLSAVLDLDNCLSMGSSPLMDKDR